LRPTSDPDTGPATETEQPPLLLNVDQLHVRFGSLVAVQEVSLGVPAGDVRCLLGPNGAGKSSILNAIAGRVKPSGGTVTLNDDVISQAKTFRVARAGVALCPQNRDMFANLSVLEKVLGIFAPLRKLTGRMAGSLSGGEQQMVAISRALMMRPALLLLDEPSAGLAPIVVDAIFAALQELAKSSLSILIAEQNVQKAFEIASYGYVVSNGRVHREGPTSALQSDPAIVEAYLGDYADV
jgi:branched-chain amino acid transport system ATP-binding protein